MIYIITDPKLVLDAIRVIDQIPDARKKIDEAERRRIYGGRRGDIADVIRDPGLK